MARKYTLKIRLGAAHDSVEVAGLVFDRSKMNGQEKSKLREQVVLGLMDHGQLPKHSRRLPFKVREELDRRRSSSRPAKSPPAFSSRRGRTKKTAEVVS